MTRKKVTPVTSEPVNDGKLKGFQEAANFSDIPEDICFKLPVEWPDGMLGIGRALRDAGLSGDITSFAQKVAAWRPAAAAPVTPVSAEEVPEKPTKDDITGPSAGGIAQKLGLDSPLGLMMLMGSGGGNLMKAIPVRPLIEMYDPSDLDNYVTGVLQARFPDEAVIAFLPGTNEVAKDATIEYINARRNNKTKRQEFIRVNGEMVRLFRPGVLPNDVVYEDPLFGGELNYQMVSDADPDVSYEGMKLDVLQFLRVFRDNTSGFNPRDFSSRSKLLETASQGLEALMKSYSRIAVIYRELAELDNLPKLRKQVGTVGGSTTGGDSFRPDERPGKPDFRW